MHADHLAEPDPPDAAGHQPVMVEQVLDWLDPQPHQTMLDCTVGRGGHLAVVGPRLAPDGRYIGIDVDPANIEFLQATTSQSPVRLELWRGNFADADRALNELSIGPVDGLLADLGFASAQMDDPARGLSFQADGPLDMRLDPMLAQTAADLVRRLPERELADLFWQYGQERLSRRIARKIVDQRRKSPIRTTRQLAELCAAAYGAGRRRQRIHPATRVFQALRIAVNDELGRLEVLLGKIGQLVRPGGRVVVISFHSLEDRLVKTAMRQWRRAADDVMWTPKPIRPTDAQRRTNPRCRSARLRAIRLPQTQV